MIAVYLLSIYLLCVALAGAVYTELPKHIRNMSFVYFGLSLTAQLMALPFLILTGGLFVASLTLWSPSPWLAGINVAAAVLFTLNLWRSFRGARVLDEVLQKDGRTSVGKSLFAGLFPFVTAKKNVTRIADIAYGDAGKKNFLDIYIPRQKPDAPMPVIIHIHGGAWVVGRKKQQAKPLIQHLVSQGWMAIDINYRLGPKNKFPVIFGDVLRAIAWVKTHIADYGGDPSFVTLTGGSAGGHLTALAALMPNNPDFKIGFENIDCSVNAAVPVYGVYDFLDRTGELAFGQAELEAFLTKLVMPGPPDTHRDFWDTASPMGNIHAGAPPMFMIHGRYDALAAFKGAEIFVDALQKTSRNEVIFAALPSGQHAFDVGNGPPTGAHVRAVERFLNKVRAEKNG